MYEVLESVIQNKRVKQKLNSAFLSEINEMQNFHIDESANNYCRYICSFSLNPDSLSLWNYYTKTVSGTGYNIGFSWKSLIEKINVLNEFETIHGKVLYEKEEQTHILEYALIGYNSAYISATSDTERVQVLDQLRRCFNILSVYLKHPAFADEEEVRICITPKTNPTIPRKANYRESNGIFVPYITVHFFVDAVKRITISPINQKELSINGISNMILDLGYTDVSIQISEIPLRY